MADSRWLMAIGEEPMADPSTLLRVSPEPGRGTDGVLLMARQWRMAQTQELMADSRWLMARQRTEGIFSAE